MKARMPPNLREASLIGVWMNGLWRLGFLGLTDFPALAMFPGGRRGSGVAGVAIPRRIGSLHG